MGENVIALKALYTALGGDADDVANITTSADMIYKLAAIAPSIGGLPAVTSEDNGMILTVVNGKWAKAAAPVGLPAVSATNDGKILKVVDGAWALADDAIEA